MSWFDEQVRARQKQDEERLEDSFIHVAESVLGGKGSRISDEKDSPDEDDGALFSRPLPMRKLGIRDLIVYMFHCLRFGDVVRIIVSAVLVSLMGLTIPALTHAVIGPVASLKNVRLLVAVAMSLALIRLSQVMFGAFKELIVERMKLRTAMMVEAAVMSRLLLLNVAFFRKYSSGETAIRAISIRELCDIIIEEIFGMGLLSLTSLIYVVEVVRYGSFLVFPSLSVILLTFAVMAIGAVLRMKVNEKHLHHEAMETGMKYALILGIRKIRLAGAEDRAFARWASMYAEGAGLVYDPPLFLKIESAIQKGIQLTGVLVIYGMAIHIGMSMEDYYAFNAAYGLVMGAFVTLGSSVNQLALIRPVMHLAEPILQAEPEVQVGRKKIENMRTNIEFSHVSFRYQDNTPFVLNDLNLTIRPGEYVAVVGRTGCGKTTLVRLLLGFETAERGALCYGNRDIRKLDLKSLRSKIGVVMQSGDLVPGSIYDNITLTAPGLSEEDAWEAAETAGIADVIRSMPMGMSTMLSEGQGSISGGQKQRLLIARALASKPQLLILDEATSALDNRTQRQVTEALDKLTCTRIVVAHRLSTIRACDRILVMDGGRIIEDGTYDELIAKNGLFKELTDRQQL